MCPHGKPRGTSLGARGSMTRPVSAGGGGAPGKARSGRPRRRRPAGRPAGREGRRGAGGGEEEGREGDRARRAPDYPSVTLSLSLVFSLSLSLRLRRWSDRFRARSPGARFRSLAGFRPAAADAAQPGPPPGHGQMGCGGPADLEPYSSGLARGRCGHRVRVASSELVHTSRSVGNTRWAASGLTGGRDLRRRGAGLLGPQGPGTTRTGGAGGP